jgi:hypothetical protein
MSIMSGPGLGVGADILILSSHDHIMIDSGTQPGPRAAGGARRGSGRRRLRRIPSPSPNRDSD